MKALRLSLIVGALVLSVAPVRAQVVVYDPAVVTRNSITAVIKEYLAELQTQQHSQLRRMAHRLSNFTDLGKYRVAGAPLWRIHDFEDPNLFRFARDYHAALNYGDEGGGVRAVTQALLNEPALLARLTPAARRALTAPMATLDVAAATLTSGTNDTGRVRYNGRAELRAIQALETDVTNGSLEQSMTAVLDKISGGVLVGARQRQNRVQVLAAVVEQLAVDGKRARDTEAATLNMQLTAWREREVVNAAFAAGAGDALRTWRQP
ncbi:hypothetical protein [Luteitalea sp.]|uniref:hypothetical protein n=1 Tax=Luteitalea sp. TaxID=2004800 RepID=UPI0025BA90D8|nr:hypothetical protein [Luteitalea sp.]